MFVSLMMVNPHHSIILNVVRIVQHFVLTLTLEYANKERGEEYHYVFKKVPNELKILGEYTWVCIDMNEFNDNDPQVVDIPSD